MIIGWLAAVIAVAAVSHAHGQAMGKVALEPPSTPAGPATTDSGAAAPAAAPVANMPAAPAALETSAGNAAVPATGGGMQEPMPETPAALPVIGGLQNPAGLTMPPVPGQLAILEGAQGAARTAPQATPPQNLAPVDPPPAPATPALPGTVSAPGTTIVPAPPLPAIPSPSAPGAGTNPSFRDAIEQRSIQPRTAGNAVADSQPAPAPSHTATFMQGLGNVGQVAAALAIVIGLILVGKALARKFLPGARAAGGRGVIEILARHAHCKNQSIVLVRIGSQIVALNQGKETSESVLVISDPAEVARIIGQIEGQSPKSIQAGFNNLLANARMDLERGEEAEPEQEADLRTISSENLDEQLEEMAAAKRQLMELRQHVRSVRDSLPRS